VAITNGAAEIEHQEQIRIADCIEARLAEAGGLEVTASIFDSLKRSYDTSLDRYHIPRRTSTVGRDGGPSIPVSYLLNLCVKHIGTRTMNHSQAEMAAHSAYALATAYAATFDVEPYNTFETLFHTGSNLPRFLMEIAVYDGMFNLAQARPGWVEKTLRSLFEWLDDDTALHHLGWTIGQAARVACEIVNITSGQSGPCIFTHSSLAKGMSELPSTVLTSILSVFSHRAR